MTPVPPSAGRGGTTSGDDASHDSGEASGRTAAADESARDHAGAAAPFALREGSPLGPYRIVREIARGGESVTYEAAVGETVTRRVAVKVALEGDAQVILRRFDAERLARSTIGHPGLASILASGLTDQGRPFLVTELPLGVPLVEYCDRRALTTRERVELLASLCATVEQARNAGALRLRLDHSSVLVTEVAGRPLVRVTATGASLPFTADLTWALQPTLSAPPEKPGATAVGPEDAGPRTLAAWMADDVRSMGTLLRDLLVGTATRSTDAATAGGPPSTPCFRAPSEILSCSSPPVTDEIAIRHRTSRRCLLEELRRDLDFIVSAALDPRARRPYGSLRAFAEDLRRYVDRKPISVRRRSSRYRIERFVARRLARLASAAGLFQAALATALTSQRER